MYSNSLARHFSSMFQAKCLLPRLDKLLLVRSWLKWIAMESFQIILEMKQSGGISKRSLNLTHTRWKGISMTFVKTHWYIVHLRLKYYRHCNNSDFNAWLAFKARSLFFWSMTFIARGFYFMQIEKRREI